VPTSGNGSGVDPLLVDVHGAAVLLSLSERTVWGLTKSGQLPRVLIGRSVRYSVATLQSWIAAREKEAQPQDD
jgi:excisionase family DNA binding protein